MREGTDRRWLRGLVMGALWLGVTVVQAAAPKVLFLHTAESSTDGQQIIANALSSLTAAGATVEQVNTFDAAMPDLADRLRDGAFDAVLAVAVYATPVQANLDVLRLAAQQRQFAGLYLSLDTCGTCNQTTKAAMLRDFMGGLIDPLTYVPTTGARNSSTLAFALNTDSAYGSSFTAIQPMAAGNYTPFTSVPWDLVLYHTVSPAPAASTSASAHHLIVPGSLSHGGAGACVIATSDSSQFSNVSMSTQPANSGLGAALLNALASDGSCRVSKLTPSSLAGRVFNDVNGNGVQDSGEAPLAGVTLTAICTAGACLASGTPVVSAVSAADGMYTLTPLANGEWRLSASQVGWTVTGAVPGTGGGTVSDTQIVGLVLNADDETGYLFGLQRAPTASVHTLDVWALMGLAGLLAGLGAWWRRRSEGAH